MRAVGFWDQWLKWAPIPKVLSVLWLVLAIFMAVPWLVLVIEEEPNARAFALSIGIVLASVAVSWTATLRIDIALKPWQMFLVTMLMGRLEILTVLVLLTPMFWRR